MIEMRLWKKKGESKKGRIICKNKKQADIVFSYLLTLCAKPIKEGTFRMSQEKNVIEMYDKYMRDIPKDNSKAAAGMKKALSMAKIKDVIIKDWDGKKYEWEDKEVKK